MDKKKILIVDDDLATLEAVSIIFEEFGYLVKIAETTDHIITEVENFQPDLIIMDVSIPAIGGVEATRLLKSKKVYRNIPVLLITANNDIDLFSKQAHADAYLPKPFDIDKLEKMVAKLI